VRSEKTFPGDESRNDAILLVEDDENDVRLLRRAFRDAQVANLLVEVKDGQAAIQYLSGEGLYADRVCYPIPFLTLLDLRLPKLSGFEVLAWIRDQPHLAGLIVVVLTASDDVPDMNKAHELGANCYLVKPGTFAELAGLMKGIKARWLVSDRLGKRPAAPPAAVSI
jgi:CheY-like chemotaxis protein